MSRGSDAVAALARRHGFTEIAKRVGVTEGAIRAWASGKSKPLAKARLKLERVFDVVPAWFDEDGAGAPAAPPVAVAPSAPVPSLEVDALEQAQSNVRQLRTEVERLVADPSATPRERAGASAALTQATRLLGRLSGATEITVSQILRSAAWRGMITALIDGLRPIPGACEAAGKVLRELESRG